MFRKMMLTALLAAGTLTGLALTPATAEARTYNEYRHHRERRFEVLYLDCGLWKVKGDYCDRGAAERAARWLRHRGFAVKIDRC